MLVLAAAVATAQDESIAEQEQEQDAIQSYLGLIFERLQSHKRYPRVAERSGLNGRVVLRFTVRRSITQNENVTEFGILSGAKSDTFQHLGKNDLVRSHRLAAAFPFSRGRDSSSDTRD